MNLAAAGLERNIDKATRGRSIFGVGSVGLETYFLNRLHRRHGRHAEPVVIFSVLDSFDPDVIPMTHRPNAIDGKTGDTALRWSDQAAGRLAKQRHGARRQHHQESEIT